MASQRRSQPIFQRYPASSTRVHEEEKIHVRRVHQRPNSDSPIRLPDLEPLPPSITENIERSDFSREEPLEVDAWEGTEEIPEEDENEAYEPGELSEAGSVLTLYFSQQETIISNDEATPRETSVDSSAPFSEKLQFTRAKGKPGRSRSAPARPLTELEEFKESTEFECLEFAAMDASELLFKENGKLDLDSVDGHYSCKKFLENLEKLSKLFKIKQSNREYRYKFSQAYKVLYKEGSLCYLTEILDSAQEGFPYIIVNSEKYIFSPNVLQAGEQLFSTFIKVKDFIRDIYGMLYEETVYIDVHKPLLDLKKTLQDFDKTWTQFEKIYVLELMLIEKDARRFIMQAIEAEREMKSYEIIERLKGRIVIRSDPYDLLRKRFVDVCAQINAVANFRGKGRDDLSLEVLTAAEEISRKVSNYKSKAVRKLAAQIKASFLSLRAVFRKYAENIEVVDPQLKNNQELVDALVTFEKTWEKGKTYLLNPTTCQMLINFSQLIEGLSEKYQEVRDKLESMDADVFLLIPCLAILRSLDDNDQSIYSLYYPEMGTNASEAEAFEELRRMYSEIKRKGDSYEMYNKLEQAILERTVEWDIATQAEKLLHEIKRLAILLQRNKPTEWNSLMETAMGII